MPREPPVTAFIRNAVAIECHETPTPLTAMSMALSLRYQCGLPSPNAVNRASRRLCCGFARTSWSKVAARFKCGLWRQRYGQRRLLYVSRRFMTAAVRLQQGFSTVLQLSHDLLDSCIYMSGQLKN